MMKTLFFNIAVSLLIFSGCEKEVTNQPGAVKNNSIIADYEISLNENFVVDLVSNPSTGYSWKWANKQSILIVDTVGFRYIPDNPVLVGSGGKESWNFKGIKSGMDTIKLEYCRAWDAESTIDTKKIIVLVK